MPNKQGNGKRELIDTGTDKRYVRFDTKGQFKESDDQGRSLAKDMSLQNRFIRRGLNTLGLVPGNSKLETRLEAIPTQ